MAEAIEREFHDLYGGEVQVEFLPKSHIYNLIKDGEELPKKKRLTGVTTFTGQLDKSSPLMIWATRLYTETVKEKMGENTTFTADDLIAMLEAGEGAYKEKKEQAAGVGDYVHEFAEEYSKDKDKRQAYDRMLANLGNPPENILEQINYGCTGFIKWLEGIGANITSAEQIVYSRKHGFVGRYDAIMDIDGKKYLTDYKTSKNIYAEYYYQTSAYLHAWEEEHGEKLDGVLIVAIVKEDVTDKMGNVVKKAGDVITEMRSRSECVSDYKAFKALIDIKERQKVNVKWGN